MRRGVAVALTSLIIATEAAATWSIIIVDTHTREVAIGSATCLTNFDLLALTPVMRVGVGGAVVQAAGDFGGNRRPVIRREFLNESTPREILDILSRIAGHQDRQFGIVDTTGRAASFTGSRNGAHASGMTGRSGTLVWAIQGNVLTGRPVVRKAHRAILKTRGDVAEKLMAAMEAARQMGGDGRCSCLTGDPDDCGSPPPHFDKSAHIGYMIVSRLGDVDSDLCDRNGCARGDYFLKLNVPFQQPSSPDPVIQLRDMFDAWRADLLAQPDGVQSIAKIEPDGDSFVLTVEWRNWQGVPVTSGILDVQVRHLPDSAGATDIGPIFDLGGGRYGARLTPNGRAGVDRFQITADAGARPVTISPYPELRFPCGVLVSRTRAKIKRESGLHVRVSLVDPDDTPVAGMEVLAKLTRRTGDPFVVSLGKSKSNGRAARRFYVSPGEYRGICEALLPDEPGGQCLDRSLPGQHIRSRVVTRQ